MPARSILDSSADQQLLTQLGQRLREARRLRQLSAADLARRIGISRSTLQSVESGDASPTIGTYLKVLSSLGLSADVALLAAGEAPAAYRVEATRPPRPAADSDLRRLPVHREAVRLLSLRHDLATSARELLASMPPSDDQRTLLDMLDRRDWSDLLADTPRAARLRRVSPLARLLTPERTEEVVDRFMRNRTHRERVRPEVDAAMAELAARGVTAEVVGSFAWGEFRPQSDVDVLVRDDGGLTGAEIIRIVEDRVSSAPVDIVFFDQLTELSKKIMMRDRVDHGRQPFPREGGP